MNKQILLTKSRYLVGLNCAKAIWLTFNRPEELQEISEITQHRFDEGHKVGELAKTLFPDGIDVGEIIPIENDKKSRELLKKRKILFEAGFMHKDGKSYARADILIPMDKNEWDIVEVKSATGVKEEYLEDLSFQKYCYESAGLKIRKCFLLHVNNQYVRQGKVEPKDFFLLVDITGEVEKIMPEVPEKINKIYEIISREKCPEIKEGEEYCGDPYGVHINDRFWQDHPGCDILDLYYGGKKAVELFNQGVLFIKDLDEDYLTRKQQKIQQKAHGSGNHHIDKEEISKFIKSLKYPLYFLDFESYSTAIPLYDGLKPYQAIPFQFSLHIIKKEGEEAEHYSFIASGLDDPRLAFIAELKNLLGDNGDIIVYNQGFEKTILKKLGEFNPSYNSWIDSIVERMADLLIPFRNFVYYHPKQKGSASIKHVLPVLTGITYKDFEIANGSEASLAYLFITHGSYKGEKATAEEIKKVREDLENYCGLDTEGMIFILEKLKGLVK